MGLTRKKITVRGKRKTYQRTVMVKSGTAPIKHMSRSRSVRNEGGPMKLGDFARKHGARFMKLSAAQGVVGGVGAYAGYHADKKDRARGAAIGSLAGGLGTAAFNHRGGRLNTMNRDYNRLGALGKAGVFGAGLLANIGGHAAGIGAAHGLRSGVKNVSKRVHRWDRAQVRGNSR